MNKARNDIKAIYTAAIAAVNPANAVKNHLHRSGNKLTLKSNGQAIKSYNLDNFRNILVIGSGKATAPMAKAVEEILGDYISSGCITVKYGYIEDLSRINIIEASHPVPDRNGIEGAKKIKEILKNAGENDLVISLISGGGSSLLPLPAEPITLDEKRETTNLLLNCGATIHEINSVRKHLSLVKGGNLARLAYPAKVINLMISDVVGDLMDVIASGPFVPDNSTFNTARSILQKYDLMNKTPQSVISRIQSGIEGKIPENPDSRSDVFKNVTNLIIASNIIALQSAGEEAGRTGYNTIILSSLIEGETEDVAFFHSAIAKEVIASSNPVKRPACIISGGETTVTVTGKGLGGRNMEFAIQSALHIDGNENITIAGVGTDGTDGPTDAAGAVADGSTVKRGADLGIDINEYIKNNDSYHFFEKTGDLIKTGPTNTNVMDIRIMLIN